MKKEISIRERLREESQTQFHEDARILNKAYKEGIFEDRLKPDPLWNDQIFSGIWAAESQDRAASYSIHTLAVINGNLVEVEYYKIYKRDEVQLIIEAKGACERFTRNSKDGVLDVELYISYLKDVIS